MGDESDLLKLGFSIRDLIAGEVGTHAAIWWLRAAVDGIAGAVGTVVWPLWIVSSMAGLDNVWHCVKNKAKQAGELLAHTLACTSAVGTRPVHLLGYSMGARCIFYCL